MVLLRGELGVVGELEMRAELDRDAESVAKVGLGVDAVTIRV